MRLTYALPAALLCAALILTSQTTPIGAPVGAEDPRSRGAQFAQLHGPEFAWLLFLNLISPARPGVRGIRDPTKSIGAPVATVWETWKNVADIYLPDGSRPTPWSNLAELPMQPPPSPAQFQTLGAVDSTWIHYLAEDMMIDELHIVNKQSQLIRYDVRDNQDSFQYVVNNPSGFELFNLDGQEKALASPAFQFRFPDNAIETKSSWRILGSGDDPSRYWTAYVVYLDDQNRLQIGRAGLTGLHITSRLLPKWFWATFEQIDDPTMTITDFPGRPKQPVGPNPTYNSAATPQNNYWNVRLQGTKWQYYRLMGWQTDFQVGGRDSLLANTQMETYFERSSSCITCHFLSNISQPPSVARFALWNRSGGNQAGYTGAVNFQQVVQQQFPGRTFKQRDFVWSLRRAQPKR